MDKVKNFKEKMKSLGESLKTFKQEAEDIRMTYKYQNSHTDNISESFILAFGTIECEIDHIGDCLEELLEYEECDCEEEE